MSTTLDSVPGEKPRSSRPRVSSTVIICGPSLAATDLGFPLWSTNIEPADFVLARLRCSGVEALFAAMLAEDDSERHAAWE